MNKIIISIFILLWVAVGAMAQTATVTGMVTDDMGPVIGATVTVQGTSIGATTDLDGKFTLTSVPNVAKAVLIVRYVGMEEAKEPLKGRTSNINIHMKEAVGMLDDVVVIGYGTQKRGNLTGSIASVSGKILEKVQTTSAAEAIVGKLPGVQVTAVDGSPDAEIKILVRGGGSITQDNSPLIILDGFEVGSLNDVPPTDIESIEVLKDAASTAIYGARGANGVILVTTKRPVEGRVVISLNTYVQTKELSNKLDVMDPYEFVLMQYENARQKSSNPTAFNNKYGHAYEHYIYQGNAGTDWQDEVFGSNPVAKYVDLSVNGGTEKAKYKLSFIHQDQPSVMVGNGLKQNNMNASFNFKPFKFLTLEYRTRLLHKEVDGSGTEGVSLLSALRQKPTKGLDEYMKLPEDDTYFDPDQLEEETLFDPKEEAKRNYKKRINKSLNTMGAVTWDIMKGMTFRSEFGFENNSEEQRRFWGMETSKARSNNNQPVAEWSMKQGTKWQLTNVWNYNFMLKDVHDIRLMLGQEIKHNQTTTKTYSTRFFPENITAEKVFDNLSLGTPYENSSSAASPSRISSFFGRINYGYNDKYLATVTLRRDGSSVFGGNNKYAYFPGVSVGWKIDKEDFMAGAADKVDILKLRLGYGQSGNSGIDPYQSLSKYDMTTNGILGQNKVSGATLTNYMENPDLKWETTSQVNLGIDYGFFSRLSGNLDFFVKNTKDMLVQVSQSPMTGHKYQWQNAASMRVWGLEYSLNSTNIQTRDFEWDTQLSFSWTDNKITDYNVTDESTVAALNTIGVIKGERTNSYYTYVIDGIDPSSGSYRFKDLDGDGSITVKDKAILGTPDPRVILGFGNTFKYKNFALDIFFNANFGNKMYNYSAMNFTLPNTFETSNYMVDAMNYWSESNPNSDIAANRANGNGNALYNSRWIEDAWFIRLQNVTLSYNLASIPSLRKIFPTAKIYVQAQNLFLITPYSGLDPELANNAYMSSSENLPAFLPGSVDMNAYPPARTFTVGLNFSF